MIFSEFLPSPTILKLARILIHLFLVAILFAFVWLIFGVFNDLNQPEGFTYNDLSEPRDSEVTAHLTLGFDTEFQDSQEIFQFIDFENNQASEGYYPVQIKWLFSTNGLDYPICIERIFFLRSIHFRRLGLNKDKYTFNPHELEPVIEFHNLCFQNSKSVTSLQEEFISEQETTILIPKTYINSLRRFPLDGTYADFFVWVEAFPQGAGGLISIAPTISFTEEQPNWDQTLTVSYPTLELDNQALNATLVSIDTQRPLSTRVLTFSLLAMLTIFIFMLAFVPDVGSALEVSVGILLGLWGVQSILIPDYVEGITIVHIALYILYLLIALVAVYRFILKPLDIKIAQTISTRVGESEDQELGKTASNINVEQTHEPLTAQQLNTQSGSIQSEQDVYQKLTILFLAITTFLLGMLNFRQRK